MRAIYIIFPPRRAFAKAVGSLNGVGGRDGFFFFGSEEVEIGIGASGEERGEYGFCVEWDGDRMLQMI